MYLGLSDRRRAADCTRKGGGESPQYARLSFSHRHPSPRPKAHLGHDGKAQEESPIAERTRQGSLDGSSDAKSGSGGHDRHECCSSGDGLDGARAGHFE